MKIVKNNNDLILKNNPHPIRFLGVFFFLISSAFVYGSLGGYSNYSEATELTIKVHFLLGSMGMCVGFWLILIKSSRAVISAAKQSVNLIKSNLCGKEETPIPFYKIKEFIISDDLDEDRNPVWKVDLELESNEIIELSSDWLNDKTQCEIAANTANNILKNNQL